MYGCTSGTALAVVTESLAMTLAGDGDELFLSAITSGGSQAMFFKLNTWGEEAFLDTLRELAEKL